MFFKSMHPKITTSSIYVKQAMKSFTFEQLIHHCLKNHGAIKYPHWHVKISKSTMTHYKHEIFDQTNFNRYLPKAFCEI